MTEQEKKRYLDRSDIIIEGNTARWDMRLEGDILGTYTGSFRFKCYLLPTEKLAAGRQYRELLGPNPTIALEHEDSLAFTLSQLKQRVLSAPPFWTSTMQGNGIAGDLPDEKIINAVLETAIAAEFKYAAQVQAKKIEAIDKAKKAAEKMLKGQDEEEAEDEDESQG